MNSPNIQLSRLLYPINDVKASIIICIIKKHSFEECIYWICEYYNSGYYLKSWELLHFIYYSFYSVDYPKFGKKLGSIYKKWREKCKKLQDFISKPRYEISNTIEEKNELYNIEIEMLNDIIYCYRNIHIRKYNSTVYSIYCYDKYYYNKIEILGGQEIFNKKNINSKLLRHKYKRTTSKKIDEFYKYYINNIIEKDYENNTIENIYKNISKIDFYNICQSIKNNHLINIVYFMNKYSSYKCVYNDIENNIFITFLSILIEYFNIKIEKNEKQYIECDVIVDFIDIINSEKYNIYYLIGKIYNLIVNEKVFDSNKKEKETNEKVDYLIKKIETGAINICISEKNDSIKKIIKPFKNNKSLYLQLNTYYKNIISYNSTITPICDFLSNYQGNFDYETGKKIEPYNVLKNCYLYKCPKEITTFVRNVEYNVNIKNHNKVINNLVHIYRYKWQEYCYDTPIWNKRFDYYGGFREKQNETITFKNEDLLESFNEAYDYETDEQSKETQYYVISELNVIYNIFNLSINCEII